MISKRSARVLYTVYFFCAYVFWISPVKLVRRGEGYIFHICRRNELRFKIFKIVVQWNFWLRMYSGMAGITTLMLIPKVPVWEQLAVGMTVVIQICMALALLAFKRNYKKLFALYNEILNIQITLATFFKKPILAKKDGLENYFTITICLYCQGFVFFPTFFYYLLTQLKPVTFDRGMDILGFLITRNQGMFLFVLLGSYIGLTTCLMLTAPIMLVGYPKITNAWLAIHTWKPEKNCAYKFQTLVLYRAQQIMHSWGDVYFSLVAPYGLVCLGGCYVAMIVAIIMLHYMLGPVITLIAFQTVIIVGFLLKLGCGLLAATPEAYRIFPDSLKHADPKFGNAFALSCRPCYYHVGVFGPVNDESFLALMNDIIVANVVELLLYFTEC